MNNFLLFESERDQKDIFKINDSVRLSHLHKVLKSKVSDKIKVCLVDHGTSIGTIIELSKDQALIEASEFSPTALPWCELLIGLSRPPTCKKILEHGSTLGVSHFHFFKADLSEKSYLQSKIFQNFSYNEFLDNGISQSAIYFKRPSVVVDKFLPLTSYEDIEQKYVLSFSTNNTFETVNIDFSKRICLAIGPERGWTNKEIEILKDNNFKEIRISASVLRVETATFCALGQLELLKMRYL